MQLSTVSRTCLFFVAGFGAMGQVLGDRLGVPGSVRGGEGLHASCGASRGWVGHLLPAGPLAALSLLGHSAHLQ